MLKSMKKLAVLLCAVLLAVLIAAPSVSVAFAAGTVNETESNDTKATANTLSAGTTMKAHLSSSTDVDFFKFTTTKNGKLTFTFGHTVEEVSRGWRYDYYIKNADGTYTSYHSGNVWLSWGETTVLLPISIVANTTYLISVSMIPRDYTSQSSTVYFTGADYTLSCSFSATEYYEREFNNSYTTPTPLVAGHEIEGNLHTSGDVDYYSFTPTKNGKLNVTFSHSYVDSSCGWTITAMMKNTDGTYSTITSWTITRSYPETYEFPIIGAKANTPYFFYVSKIPRDYTSQSSDVYYTSSQYFIGYNFTATEYFEREFNDSKDSANSLPSGVDYSGLLMTGDDYDLYSFTAGKTGVINLIFKHTYSNSDRGWQVECHQKNSDGTFSSSWSWNVTLKEAETRTYNFDVNLGTLYYLVVHKIPRSYTSQNVNVYWPGTGIYTLNCAYTDAPSAYTVTYNANGGSVSPASANVTAGSSTTLPTPTKSFKITYNANNGSGAPAAQTVNLTCKGWATSSTATSANYSCGASYKPTASTTLYAVWNSPVSATLSATKPTRSGYTFLGWSTSSSATSATYSAGGTISLNTSATLYAVWKQTSTTNYTVTYNANGGSVSPTSASVAAGSTTTLPTPTKSFKITYKPNGTGAEGTPAAQTVNLTCKGWATSSTATSASYSCGASYKPTASITLYAVWNSSVTATLSSTVPTRDGYTFQGWGTSSSATTATYQPGRSITLTENTTLYAVWKKNTTTTYTVSYNANGGSVSPTSASVAAGSTTTLPTPTKSFKITYKPNGTGAEGTPAAQTVNLTCKGWATSSTATSASYSCGASYKPTASITLYAVWNSSVTATLSSTVPTRDGYTFQGWGTSSSATTATYQPGRSITLTENTTLYAVWKKNTTTTYTVSYNANGGSVSPTSASVTPGNTTTLPTPTKSFKITYNANNGSGAPSAQTVNLTCKGWATSSTATSASYSCGASYKPTANVTLYAVWASPATATLSTAKPTRSGYTFRGWSTSSGATSATYSAGGSISLTGNVTLYAVWTSSSTPTTDATIQIKNYIPRREEAYRTTITFTAEPANAPAGATVHWFLDGRDVYTGERYTVSQATESYEIQVKLFAADGAVLAESNTETVRIKNSPFAKIIAFFRMLFGRLPVFEQAFKEML